LQIQDSYEKKDSRLKRISPDGATVLYDP